MEPQPPGLHISHTIYFILWIFHVFADLLQEVTLPGWYMVSVSGELIAPAKKLKKI